MHDARPSVCLWRYVLGGVFFLWFFFPFVFFFLFFCLGMLPFIFFASDFLGCQNIHLFRFTISLPDSSSLPSSLSPKITSRIVFLTDAFPNVWYARSNILSLSNPPPQIPFTPPSGSTSDPKSLTLWHHHDPPSVLKMSVVFRLHPPPAFADMALDDVREYEKQMHEQTNIKVCNGQQEHSTNSSPSLDGLGILDKVSVCVDFFLISSSSFFYRGPLFSPSSLVPWKSQTLLLPWIFSTILHPTAYKQSDITSFF